MSTSSIDFRTRLWWTVLLTSALMLLGGLLVQAQTPPAYPPTGYRWSWATNPVTGNGTLEAQSLATGPTGAVYVGGFTKAATTVNGVNFPTPNESTGFVGKLSAAGVWQWVRAIGSATCEARVEKLATDTAGRVYAVGSMRGTLVFSPTVTLACEGDYGTFVICYDANGAFQWATKAHFDDIVSTTPTMGIDVAVVPSGNSTAVFVTGTFNGRSRFGLGSNPIELITPYEHHHAYVGKLDGVSGAWQWVRQAGTTAAGTSPACGTGTGSSLKPSALAVDDAGNVYFAANYQTNNLPIATTTGAAGPFSFRTDQSLLVGKISVNGAWQWLKTESNYDGKFSGLAVSPDGQSVAVMGRTGSGNNIGYVSNPPFCQTPVSTAYNGYPDGFNQPGLTLGTLPTVPNGGSFLASLSAAGTWQWATQPLQTGYGSVLTDVRYSPAGEVFVGGFFQGPALVGSRIYSSATSVVVRLQADGHLLESQPTPIYRDLAFDPADNMLIAGSFTGYGITNGLLMRSTRVPAPTITSFTPTQGPVGTVVTITGTSFENVLDVSAGGSGTYIVDSPTQIRLTIPGGGAGSAPLVVQTASGTATNGAFTVLAPPADVTFSPGFGSAGTPVTLRGTGFTGTTQVRFGGTNAPGFSIISDQEINVRVPSMGLGSVRVTVINPAGSAQSAALFGVGIAPTISAISPNRGVVGSSFTISGTSLSPATSVRIGSVPVTVTANTASSITATVPNSLMGAVSVTTPYGTATGPFFQPVAPAPTITFFAPASGPAGTSVNIAGTNFNEVAEARVSGVLATITARTATSMTIVVPDVASGRITLTGPGGTATSVVDFVVPTPPAPDWAWAQKTTGLGSFHNATGVTTDLQGNTYVVGNFTSQAIFGTHTLTAQGTSDAFVAKQAATGVWLWAVRLGGYGSDAAYAVRVLPGGRLVVVGYFEQTMTVGGTSVTSAGEADAFAAFLNLDGTGRTVYRGGSTSYDVATAACTQPDGTVWVAGEAASNTGLNTAVAFGAGAFSTQGSGSAFVARLTEADGFTGVGSVNIVGAGSIRATGVAVSAGGKLVVAGRRSGTMKLGPANGYSAHPGTGGYDSFVALTSTALAVQDRWNYPMGFASTTDDEAAAVAFDGEAIVVAGKFTGELRDPIHNVTLLTSAGGSDGYLVRITAVNFSLPNTFSLTRRLGGSGQDGIRALALDATGNATITGQYEGTALFGPTALTAQPGVNAARDLYVARLSAAGQWDWATPAGTNNQYDEGYALTLDAADNVVVAGTITPGRPATFGALPTLTTQNGLFTAKLGTATVPAPTLSGLTPTSGPRGTVVTVTGTNLASVNDIEFVGGPDFVNYPDILALSNTALTFAVPAGATTGAIRVTTAGGVAQSPSPFTVTGPTNIVFSPATGRTGTLVTILGTGFANVTAVRFGGVALPVGRYVVESGTTIRAYVDPASVSGPVSVQTVVGTGTSAASFTVIPPPTISGFAPASGPVGTVVTISGTGFSGATRVRFGADDVDSYTVISPTSITAVVPDSVTSGQFSVDVVTATAVSSAAFTVTQPVPTISSFTPTSGPPATNVVITGTNFTNASTVSFNNVLCPDGTWQVISPTSIAASVPPGATTGRVRVVTIGGTAVSATDFTVTAPAGQPTLSGFSPTSGPVGTSVTLTGTNLTGATGVAFNGTSATFTVTTATSITTTVPVGATDGPVSVTTPGGTATTATSFDVTTPSANGWPTSVTSSGNSQAAATVTDAAGNVYVAGFFRGTATFGGIVVSAPTSDAGFVVKYNAAGVAQWVRAIGDAGQVSLTGLTVDANGSVYVAGKFSNTFTYPQGAQSVPLTNPNPGTSRGFVGMLSSTGAIQFLTAFGSAQPVEVRALVMDLSGVLYVGGMFQQTLTFDLNPQLQLSGSGPTDGYVAALNTGTGQWTWATRAGGTGSDDLYGLAIDNASQALYASGTFEAGSFTMSTGGQPALTNQGSIDLWVARLSLGGVAQWTRGGASNSADYGHDVAVGPNGTLYLLASGFANGTLGGNSIPVVNPFGWVAVARLTPGGSWLTGVAVAGGGTSAAFFNYVSGARVVVATNGQATVTGRIAGQALFGSTTLDAGSTFAGFAARTTTAGTGWAWAQQLGSTDVNSQVYGAAVTLDPTQTDAYVVGTFTGTLELNGVTLTTGSFVNNAFVARVAPPAGPPALPTVTALSPTAGPTGTVVTFTGTNLTGATAVSFNGQAAVFGSVTATSLTATVPPTATSGPVSVTTPGGTATGPAFAVTASVPVITSFSPTSGPAGTSVTLSGQHLGLATEVRFNGLAANITGNTATLLTCTVPVGATDGPISVTTAGGTGTSATPFDVTGPTNTPVITAISPLHAPQGTLVTISGQFLTTATQVRFNGTPASFYVSGQNLMAAVPMGATSGTIAVTTPVDDAGSPQPFQLDLVVLSDQLVDFGLYYDVTIAPGATATLTGALLDVSHALTVRTGATLDFGGGVVTGTGSFTNEAGSTLIIHQPEGLTLAPATQGDVQVSGARTFAAEADYVYVRANQVTGAALPATVRNLTVESGADVTLTNPVGVRQVLRLNGSGNLRTNGRMLTLRSDATGSAMLVNGGSGRVIGTATVERFLTADVAPGLGYRHLSSPVQATTVSDLAVSGSFTPLVNAAYNAIPTPTLPAAQYPTVFGFDETRGGAAPDFNLGYYSPTALSSVLTPGRGYSVYMRPVKPDFVGTLTQDELTLTGLTRTGASTVTAEKPGWHFLGNPYPSPLDWDLVPVPTGLGAAVFVWKTQGGPNGVYLTRTNGIGSLQDGLLPTAQGFWVQLSGAGPVSLTLPTAARPTTYDNPLHYRPAAETRSVVTLTLGAPGSAATARDAAYVYAEPGATPGLDARYDAVRPGHNVGLPTLASLSATGEELAINGLPEAALRQTTAVELLLDVPTAGTWELTAAALTNLDAVSVTLVDALTATRYDLHQQPVVTFTAARAGALRGRFRLEFGPRVTGLSAESTVRPLTVLPNPATGAVRVSGVAPGTAVELRDATGRLVRTLTAVTAETLTLDLTGLAPGVYVVRAGGANARLVVE